MLRQFGRKVCSGSPLFSQTHKPFRCQKKAFIFQQVFPSTPVVLQQHDDSRKIPIAFILTGVAFSILGMKDWQVTSCEYRKTFTKDSKANMLQYLKKELDEVRNTIPPEYRSKVSVQEQNNTFIFKFKVSPSCNSTESVAAFVLGAPGSESKSMELLDAADDLHKNTSARIAFKDENGNKGSICLFHPTPMSTEFVLYKDNEVNYDDLERLIRAYEKGTKPRSLDDPIWQQVPGSKPFPPEVFRFFEGDGFGAGDGVQGAPGQGKDPIERLRLLGATVHEPRKEDETNGDDLSWDSLAGYKEVKEEIDDTVIMALQYPKVYDSIARSTRVQYESNRPKSVLFEGPPGTGKTTAARIIASQSGVHMVYVPIESIMSKWYGESENQLSQIFDACDELGDCIIFLDEIDALATSRESGTMHEATRRLLSVLLRKIEGFDSQLRRSIVIGATNRKQDLDAALLSRFDISVYFGLPDTASRTAIYARYAKQLCSNDLEGLSEASTGLSGRDIKDVCQQAERRWASDCVRNNGGKAHDSPPTIKYYQKALARRLRHVASTSADSDAVHF